MRPTASSLEQQLCKDSHVQKLTGLSAVPPQHYTAHPVTSLLTRKAKPTDSSQSFGITYKFHLYLLTFSYYKWKRSLFYPEEKNHLHTLQKIYTKHLTQALGLMKYSNVSSWICKLTTKWYILKTHKYGLRLWLCGVGLSSTPVWHLFKSLHNESIFTR